jgi:hypothetical protein
MLFMTGLYFIAEYAKKNKAELEAMPLDKEVAAYEAKARHGAALHAHVTEWRKVSLWVKGTLVVGASCMGLASYAIVFYPDLCFKQYDLTNSIKCDLDGNIANLVLSGGIVSGRNAMLLLLISVVCLEAYGCWAKSRKAALTEAEKQQVIHETDAAWKSLHRRLSSQPFIHDEAAHESWRTGSKRDNGLVPVSEAASTDGMAAGTQSKPKGASRLVRRDAAARDSDDEEEHEYSHGIDNPLCADDVGRTDSTASVTVI